MRPLVVAIAVALGASACGAQSPSRSSDPAQRVARADVTPQATPRSGAALDTALFAGGCFWCMEPPFDRLPGVVSTTSGYTSGRMANPTYEAVSAGGTGHTEAVQVVFDPVQVSYERLLTVFWRNIDPFARDRQFCDRGDQYRSGIYPRTPSQQRAAQASRQAVAARFKEPIATEIVAASRFYAAEDYHQDYYEKNPVRYKYYRFSCGRDARLKSIWGDDAGG